MEQPYTFIYLDKAVYSTYNSREVQEKLRKWGFSSSMVLCKFRFDLPFNEFEPRKFLIDLANSQEVSAVFYPFQAAKKSSSVSNLSFSELRCTVTSMDYFDFLKEKELVYPNGNIKKVIPDYNNDIEICDKIREVLLCEESEDYGMLDETYTNEFLFRIFQHIAIGGGCCQYEDEIDEYLNTVKGLYKDVVAVSKDSETNEVKVVSKVYQILPGEEFNVFLNPHIQDFIYVIVDPSYRHVNLWYHKWTGMW